MLAMRLPLRRLLLFAGAHAVVTLCLMLYAFSAGMAEFDDPDLPHSATARTAGTLAGVLLAPGRFVWTVSPTKNLPNASRVPVVSFLLSAPHSSPAASRRKD